MVGMEQTMSEDDLRLPAMREEIRYAVAALANSQYQNDVWKANRMPEQGYCYSFDMACHALLDDIDVYANTNSLIGDVFLNEKELMSVRQLVGRLREIIRLIGKDATFDVASRSPSWPDVIEAAGSALISIGAPKKFP
jgi:hypothetical protein